MGSAKQLKKRLSIVLLSLVLGAFAWMAIYSFHRVKHRHGNQVTEITLERRGCYGGCPVYKVVLNKDSTAIYTGMRNVDRIGRYKGFVHFDRIAAWMESQGFFDLDEEYAKGWQDSEVVVTSAVRGGTRKTVTTYNSGEPPLELWGINAAIDGALTQAGWAKAP